MAGYHAYYSHHLYHPYHHISFISYIYTYISYISCISSHIMHIIHAHHTYHPYHAYHHISSHNITYHPYHSYDIRKQATPRGCQAHSEVIRLDTLLAAYMTAHTSHLHTSHIMTQCASAEKHIYSQFVAVDTLWLDMTQARHMIRLET